MNLLQYVRPTPGVESQILFHIAGFPISNTTFLELFIVFLLGILGLYVIYRFSVVPKKKIQHVLELSYEYIVTLIRQTTGNQYVAERVFPLVATIIIFLLVSNLIGLIPGLTSITYDGVAFFRTPTADINTTLGLAIACMLVIHVTSIRDWGFFAYIGNFIKIKHVVTSFKKGFSNGMLAIIDFFIGLLDIIGELAKVVSLSLRLFGNMYAGEVLMTILVGLVAYVVPAAWLGLSLLSAVVQAIVFGALVTIFFSLAVRQEPRKRKGETLSTTQQSYLGHSFS